MTESHDPRLETAHLELVIRYWREMGLRAPSIQELFATEILRLRTALDEARDLLREASLCLPSSSTQDKLEAWLAAVKEGA